MLCVYVCACDANSLMRIDYVVLASMKGSLSVFAPSIHGNSNNGLVNGGIASIHGSSISGKGSSGRERPGPNHTLATPQPPPGEGHYDESCCAIS